MTFTALLPSLKTSPSLTPTFGLTSVPWKATVSAPSSDASRSIVLTWSKCPWVAQTYFTRIRSLDASFTIGSVSQPESMAIASRLSSSATKYAKFCMVPTGIWKTFTMLLSSSSRLLPDAYGHDYDLAGELLPSSQACLREVESQCDVSPDRRSARGSRSGVYPGGKVDRHLYPPRPVDHRDRRRVGLVHHPSLHSSPEY